MICDNCKKNEATVYVKQTENGKVTEMYICADCAAEKGLYGMMPKKLNISELFPGFFGGASPSSSAHQFQYKDPHSATSKGGIPQVQQGERCPKCGMSVADFREKGKFGCDECYATYGKKLEPLFKRLHGSSSHKGKAPASALKRPKTDIELEKLRGELTAAIKEEAYEQAAVLRDKIRKLEQKTADTKE